MLQDGQRRRPPPCHPAHSTGEHEAVELRDGDPRRYAAKEVRKAVANVNDIIAPQKTDGLDPTEQSRIDSD